jgi:hypothetical protein
MNLAYSPPLLLRCLCVLTIDICLFLCFSDWIVRTIPIPDGTYINGENSETRNYPTSFTGVNCGTCKKSPYII